MSLQSRLDEITTRTRALVQPERLVVVDQSIQDLQTSGIASRVLPVGSPAPDFSLIDSKTSKPVHARDLLALGKLVVVFFRGRWCPYDMAELEAWQLLMPDLRARGMLLVAVSPQLPRQNDFTASQHGLSFPLLSDPGCALAAKFGIAYSVPEPLQRHYRSILVNLPLLNGSDPWHLPLPSTFVLTPNPNDSSAHGVVLSACAQVDHRVRPEPSVDVPL